MTVLITQGLDLQIRVLITQRLEVPDLVEERLEVSGSSPVKVEVLIALKKD